MGYKHGYDIKKDSQHSSQIKQINDAIESLKPLNDISLSNLEDYELRLRDIETSLSNLESEESKDSNTLGFQDKTRVSINLDNIVEKNEKVVFDEFKVINFNDIKVSGVKVNDNTEINIVNKPKKYLGISGDGGILYSSADGILWIPVNFGNFTVLRCFYTEESNWVVYGVGEDQKLFVNISKDGDNWKTKEITNIENLNGRILIENYKNKVIFITDEGPGAVNNGPLPGDNGTMKFYNSYDYINFIENIDYIDYNVKYSCTIKGINNNIAYSNNYLLMLCKTINNNKFQILKSSDGVAWDFYINTEIKYDNSIYNNALLYGNDEFIVLINNKLYYVDDKILKYINSSNIESTESIENIYYINNYYIITYQSNYYYGQNIIGNFSLGSDNINITSCLWDGSKYIFTYIENNTQYIGISSNLNKISKLSNSSGISYMIYNEKSNYTLELSKSIKFAYNYSNIYSYQDNSWVKVNNSNLFNNGNVLKILFNGRIWIAMTSPVGQNLVYSYDGINWNVAVVYNNSISEISDDIGYGSMYDIGGDGPSDIVYNGFMFLIVGQDNPPYYSYDGIKWYMAKQPPFTYNMNISGNENTTALYWTGDKYIVGATYDGLLAYSYDGNYWVKSNITYPSGYTKNPEVDYIYGITKYNNEYLASTSLNINNAKRYIIISSPDGINWTENKNIFLNFIPSGITFYNIPSNNICVYIDSSKYKVFLLNELKLIDKDFVNITDIYFDEIDNKIYIIDHSDNNSTIIYNIDDLSDNKTYSTFYTGFYSTKGTYNITNKDSFNYIVDKNTIYSSRSGLEWNVLVKNISYIKSQIMYVLVTSDKIIVLNSDNNDSFADVTIFDTLGNFIKSIPGNITQISTSLNNPIIYYNDIFYVIRENQIYYTKDLSIYNLLKNNKENNKNIQGLFYDYNYKYPIIATEENYYTFDNNLNLVSPPNNINNDFIYITKTNNIGTLCVSTKSSAYVYENNTYKKINKFNEYTSYIECNEDTFLVLAGTSNSSYDSLYYSKNLSDWYVINHFTPGVIFSAPIYNGYTFTILKNISETDNEQIIEYSYDGITWYQVPDINLSNIASKVSTHLYKNILPLKSGDIYNLTFRKDSTLRNNLEELDLIIST
jgi:hypothetical protein